MKLHEIIETFEQDEELPWETIIPFKRQLYTYYKEYYGEEPVVMVTAVFNALQFVKIVPETEFCEALYFYREDFDDQEREAEIEVISANSKFLKQLI